MSNPTSFMNGYVSAIQNLINNLEALRTQNDMLTQDATLITRYFSSQGARTDIVAADITNAEAAVTQLLFTFDSGSPTQKSYLFKTAP
jgi:putative heme iron utilization protein